MESRVTAVFWFGQLSEKGHIYQDGHHWRTLQQAHVILFGLQEKMTPLNQMVWLSELLIDN